MPRPGWSGRKVTRAIAWVVTKYRGICWLCNHPGATSLDHVVPVSIDPTLEWDPTNWRASHLASAGHPKGCQTPGCTCPGNTGRKNAPAELPPSRTW